MKTRIYHSIVYSIWTVLCLALLWSDRLSAHEIHLKNGWMIKTRSIEERGAEIVYERRGGTIGIRGNYVADL